MTTSRATNHSLTSRNTLLNDREQPQRVDIQIPTDGVFSTKGQSEGEPEDEKRALLLAKVYRYLLARADEIEAGEQQTWEG